MVYYRKSDTLQQYCLGVLEAIVQQTNSEELANPLPLNPMDDLDRRLGKPDLTQVKIWQQMTPAQRAKITFKAYQFALEAVRTSERRLHPNLSTKELAWRVTRRMQGNPNLGRSPNGTKTT